MSSWNIEWLIFGAVYDFGLAAWIVDSEIDKNVNQ